jgi:hypothetical protein
MIAISYRREDSTPVTGRLYDRLRQEFGKGNVFMDFDSIPYGIDFREHIRQSVQRAQLLVVVIGPKWAGGNEKADRRIDEPGDFVRLEIAEALKRGIPVIPVLINNTPMPSAESLPSELEPLAFRNGIALDTGIDFHHHADRLIAGIRKVIDTSSSPIDNITKEKQPAVTGERRAKGWIAVTFVILALIAALCWWFVTHHKPSVTTEETAHPTAAKFSPPPSIRPPSVATSEKHDVKVGDLVFVNLKKYGRFYAAQITARQGDRIEVRYDDGTEEDTTVLALAGLSPAAAAAVKPGDRVTVNWKNTGRFYDARVTAREGDKIHVQYDDGGEEDTTVSAIACLLPTMK